MVCVCVCVLFGVAGENQISKGVWFGLGGGGQGKGKGEEMGIMKMVRLKKEKGNERGGLEENKVLFTFFSSFFFF